MCAWLRLEKLVHFEYTSKKLPRDLSKSHFQKFCKILRKTCAMENTKNPQPPVFSMNF